MTWREDDAALLRNLADGHETNLNLEQNNKFLICAFSPDGKLLAVASMYGFAKLFDVDTPRELATLHGFLMGVHSVAFSPDGTRLALGSDGREAVKLWDVASLQEVATLGARFGILPPSSHRMASPGLLEQFGRFVPLARAVLGRNQCGGGEGEGGDHHRR